MALIVADRVAETSVSTGTGALTLAAAITGFQRFSAACSTNDTAYYAIVAVDGNGNPSGAWECGLGTYSSANTLTRTTPQASSNSGSAVNFGAGTKYVYLSSTAAHLATLINTNPTESFIIACSDETTAITTGTAKATFRMPYAFTVTDVRASVNTAPTGSTILIDINEGGTTILSTKLMIDASEKTSTTAATPYVLSDTSLADDAEMTIDFDQVGSTIAGKGVKVVIIGHRT
jgi:hypothetical protein